MLWYINIDNTFLWYINIDNTFRNDTGNYECVDEGVQPDQGNAGDERDGKTHCKGPGHACAF